MALDNTTDRAAAAMPCLTTRGRFVRLAGIVLLLAGMAFGAGACLQLGLFLLLLLGAARLLARRNLTGVTCALAIPESVCRNETFEVELRVCNARRLLPALDVEMEVELLAHQPVCFDSIPAGGTGVRCCFPRLARRGVYTRFHHALVSHFPLGLFRHALTGVAERTLVVCPEPRLPPDLRDDLGSGAGAGQQWHTRALDLLGEFRTLREFQPGDRMKLVAWPHSARRGRLIVREMEQPGLQHCTVVFHSFQPPQTIITQKAFERSLQILSGLFRHFQENGIPFEFLASFHQWERLAAHHDPAAVRRLLRLLAEARMRASSDFDPVRRVIESNQWRTEALVIVSNAPVRLWARLVPACPVPVIAVDTRQAVVLPGSGVTA